MTPPDRLTITVIMPAYNASHLLAQVLTPLLEMRTAGEIDEVLVVDDRSTDDTAAAARAMGATVLVTPQNGGPGVARNLASEHAIGTILWFVDSDVIAQPGGAALIRRAFADPGVDAVFGSYDDDPGGTYWFSRYKNLLHRYHHQAARREVRTFWAGCGAVRASAFRKVGGFDVETYRKPSIEDIELGYRLTRAGGRIVVEPDLLGKHLKVWTVRNAIHTDIYRRALPWARLMITREGLGNELNTGSAERVRALVALLLLLSLPALLFWPHLWPVTLVLAAAAVLGNWDLARFFYRNGGLAFAAKSLLYHQLYYVYSATVYVWCLFEFRVLGISDRLHVR